jgi:peptidoglycan biosynthesis protein MviN/MurJ (putative lipid II flippase)
MSSTSKNILSLWVWLAFGALLSLAYMYIGIWLLAHALAFSWGTSEMVSAWCLMLSALMAVSFLTKKIYNILDRLARRKKGCYTVYVIDDK